MYPIPLLITLPYPTPYSIPYPYNITLQYYIPLMAPLICYVGFRYENEHGKQLETVMSAFLF